MLYEGGTADLCCAATCPQAKAYCKWLSERHGRTGEHQFRTMTEAEHNKLRGKKLTSRRDPHETLTELLTDNK